MQLWLVKFTLLLLCVTAFTEDLRHLLETPMSGRGKGRRRIQAKLRAQPGGRAENLGGKGQAEGYDKEPAAQRTQGSGSCTRSQS